jgi:hypothetical protein
MKLRHAIAVEYEVRSVPPRRLDEDNLLPPESLSDGRHCPPYRFKFRPKIDSNDAAREGRGYLLRAAGRYAYTGSGSTAYLSILPG